MFTFDAIEKSMYNGVSLDRVPDSIKNSFSMLFGANTLNNRILVKLSPRQIQFFYYDHDYEVWNPNGVKDNDFFKEVGYVSLTRCKDTGNDILDFPQNIGDLELYRRMENERIQEASLDNEDTKDSGLFRSMKGCLDIWETEYYSFPFINDYKTKNAKLIQDPNKLQNKVKDEGGLPIEKESSYRFLFRCFLRCCFLDFIYEFENRGQNFGASPIYDDVRNSLRESDVYKLLTAKIHYTQYLYKGKHFPRNQEKYTFYTQKFADGLMDKRINKVIPPDNYYVTPARHGKGRVKKMLTWEINKGNENNDEKQGWFYNPEEELEAILVKNREHAKKRHEEKKKQKQQQNEKVTKVSEIVTLKEALVSKMRSFLYSKHSVKRAMTNRCGKILFCVSQFLMLGWNVVMIVCSLNFQNGKWNWLFDTNMWLMIAWGLSIVVVIGCSGGKNGGGISEVLNAFFPRIIVAEAAAWLTIGIAEDLVKSMLWAGGVLIIVAVFAVLGLVEVLIFGESKQHSPYLRRGENVFKAFLIMNHSLFFALAMGCVMQLAFYNNLLKTSNVLSEVVYKEHFDKVEDYLKQLENVEKSFNEYRVFARDYEFGNLQFIGKNQGKTGLKGNLKLFGSGVVDSVALSLESALRFGTDLKPSSGEHVCEYHNALADNIKRVVIETTDSVLMVLADSIVAMDAVNGSIIVSKNMDLINGIMSHLKLEIQETRKHLMDDGYETLKNWATVNLSQEGSGETKSKRLNALIDESKKNKYSMSLSVFGKDRCFYPTLLLLHTLIVLVLAFITQLIISDKSVTEPL